MTKEEKHEDRDHAKVFSPSHYEKLMKCSGSPLESEGMPDIKHIAATVGTYGHEIAEKCLRDPKGMLKIIEKMTNSRNLPKEIPNADVDDLRIYPRAYAEYVHKLLGRFKPYRTFIEERIKFDDEIWGTLDKGFVYKAKDDDGLVVIDYKHGFKSVQAKGNPQIVIYAWGLCKKLGIEPYKTTCIIYQPRVPGEEAVRRVNYTWHEMLEWHARILQTKSDIKEVIAGFLEPKYAVGDWCFFCRGKIRCAAHIEKNNVDGILDVDKPLLPVRMDRRTDEQIVQLLEREDPIKAIFKAMRLYGLQRAADKNPIPGTKISEGKSQRRWDGTISDRLEYLETLGIGEDEVIEIIEKMRGIVEIQKKVVDTLDRNIYTTQKARNDQAYKIMMAITVKPPGQPSLVLESDKRPAIEITFDSQIVKSEDLLSDIE